MTNPQEQAGMPKRAEDVERDEVLANLPDETLSADECAQVRGGMMRAGSDHVTMENVKIGTLGSLGFNPK